MTDLVEIAFCFRELIHDGIGATLSAIMWGNGKQRISNLLVINRWENIHY